MIIKNFKKKYDQEISFPLIKVKKQLVLKGSNGSGKTTLLKAIRGMIRYKGYISESGFLVLNKGLPKRFKESDLGYIFNLECGKKRISSLSKGNIQWLLLRCALKFDVLLLDEPLDGLDLNRKELLIKKLREKKVIITTHTDFFDEFETYRI